MLTVNAEDIARASVVCLEALVRFKQRCSGLRSAIVSTTDGFLIAEVGDHTGATKIGVMAGSMHALGDAISREAQAGECSCVTVEAAGGQIVVVAGHDRASSLVIAALGGAETTLGMLRHFSCECASEVSQSLSS